MSTLRANTKNLPNPAKLLDSLRATGYDNYNAIADIIDNSLDADAVDIIVDIHTQKNDFNIIIADNGRGMNEHILDEALKLGSETEKDYQSDLGRFGMGLSTASLSMCTRTEVITKEKNNKPLKSITDLEWIKETNEFTKYLGNASEEDVKLFKQYLGESDSGTIIILTKCDRIQNNNVTQFVNILKKELARIFRRFLEAGKQIIVNSDKLKPIDPLMLEENNTRIYSDENYEINISKGDKIYADTIRIKLVIVPDFGFSVNKERGINYINEGFYVMRNQRELFAGSNLGGVFTKDAHLTRFRAEIYFSGALDDLMGVHFTKRSFSIDQSLLDTIKEFTKSQISQIKNIADSERPLKEKVVSHKESEELISKKSKLLIKPPAKEENNKDKAYTDKSRVREKTERESDYTERLRSICKFEERAMEKVGPLYSPVQKGKKVIVTWNSDHPFYKLLIDKKEDKTFVNALDFFVYSLASAELKEINEDNVTLLENLRQLMSSNLRVLID